MPAGIVREVYIFRRMKMKKFVVFLGAVTIGALLAGCASEPVINEFMDPNLPVRENAALSVHTNVMIGSVDGSLSFSGKYGGNAKGREPKQKWTLQDTDTLVMGQLTYIRVTPSDNAE